MGKQGKPSRGMEISRQIIEDFLLLTLNLPVIKVSIPTILDVISPLLSLPTFISLSTIGSCSLSPYHGTMWDMWECCQSAAPAWSEQQRRSADAETHSETGRMVARTCHHISAMPHIWHAICHICVINISDIILPSIYIYCSIEGKGKGMATN